jgi:hypothetical protein
LNLVKARGRDPKVTARFDIKIAWKMSFEEGALVSSRIHLKATPKFRVEIRI